MARSLKEQLANIDLRKARLSNGVRVDVMMAGEMRRLYNCIQKYIDEYYNSYTPVIYDRTFQYKKSLTVEDIADIRVVGKTLRIALGFDSILSRHPNLEEVYHMDALGNEYSLPIINRHESFVPLLMERGWNAPRLANMLGKDVYRLTYFEGIRAVENGVRDFNEQNPYEITVNADEFYKMKVY